MSQKLSSVIAIIFISVSAGIFYLGGPKGVGESPPVTRIIKVEPPIVGEQLKWTSSADSRDGSISFFKERR